MRLARDQVLVKLRNERPQSWTSSWPGVVSVRGQLFLARSDAGGPIPRGMYPGADPAHHSRDRFRQLSKWRTAKTWLGSCFSNRTFAGHTVWIAAAAILEAFDRLSDQANSRYSYMPDQANSREVTSQGAFAKAHGHGVYEPSIGVR
jgi:hypothetical protein